MYDIPSGADGQACIRVQETQPRACGVVLGIDIEVNDAHVGHIGRGVAPELTVGRGDVNVVVGGWVGWWRGNVYVIFRHSALLGVSNPRRLQN